MWHSCSEYRYMLSIISFCLLIFQLDKISTLSRGKDKKEKGRCDMAIMRQRTIEELARDEQQMSNFQQTINRLSDYEINSKFEQLLVSSL